jgi:hypothetical protein
MNINLRIEGDMQTVSELFNPEWWKEVPDFKFTDITYHRACHQGTVRIALNRPEVRNAFRPHTVDELFTALEHARQCADVGVVFIRLRKIKVGHFVRAETNVFVEKTDTNMKFHPLLKMRQKRIPLSKKSIKPSSADCIF